MNLFFKILFSVAILGGIIPLKAQIRLEKSFVWEDQTQVDPSTGKSTKSITFASAATVDDFSRLPVAQFRFPLQNSGTLKVSIVRANYENLDWEPAQATTNLVLEQLEFRTNVTKNRNRFFGSVYFLPIVKNGNVYKRLTSIELAVDLVPSAVVQLRSPNDVTVSKLSDGELYKISVEQNGVHKLTYAFLRDELGINVDQIDPRSIQILGDRGGMLLTNIAIERNEDVVELPIKVIGEDDGRFDPNDYILFYGEGPHRWLYDGANNIFNEEHNYYDDKNYYFIKIAGGNGLRVSAQNSISNTAFTSNAFNDFARFEEDSKNIMHDWNRTQGSGQEWFGDYFKNQRTYTYNNLFEFPGLITGEPVHIASRMALRANRSSTYNLTIDGQVLTSSRASFVSDLGDNEVDLFGYATIASELNISNSDLSFTVEYPFPRPNDGSEGWLDFIQANVRRTLALYGDQTSFRDLQSTAFPTTTFNIDNAAGALVWEITNPFELVEQNYDNSGNSIQFGVETDELRTFVVFNPTSELLSPAPVGPVFNQNIHGFLDLDMLIIYHSEFESEAQRLAEHRRSFSKLKVETASVDQIMNEFASGAKDPTAIRDFLKVLYDRSQRFRYVLLFGDASFDPRDVYSFGRDFIPVYQRDSSNPIFAFPADDYYAILEPDNNTRDPLSGDLNVAVGRLPVNSLEEASVVVNKIINYDNNPNTLDEWRNQLIFVGDDEDSGRHAKEVDEIAENLDTTIAQFNLEKIYLDAFPQESTPGGTRFPQAQSALNQSIEKGALVVTYLGHGGAQGWAQERVLSLSDINSWENLDRLPVFITATCSFAGYDDVQFTSGGEQLLLSPIGGAVALLTTTRAVFASRNEALTKAVTTSLFIANDNRTATIGDAMVDSKNEISGTNSRKFTLLGDPAQRLGLARLEVVTQSINGKPLSEMSADTLKALERVEIEGQILDENGQINEAFNGELFSAIFDKPVQTSTLGQDPRSDIVDYKVQKNLLFKGKATVENGKFKFAFVVPKDINFEFGVGKISYYARDPGQLLDAAGGYQEIIIGGFGENLLSDNIGPKIDVYMNTEGFAFGGITDENPVLLVKLEDDNGINVVGNSIGHDLEGILDDDTENTFLLNDFYQAELNDYTKGVVEFPLQNIETGRHNIRVKAWDVANNSSEGYTEFVVAESAELALEHVLNYPNPFTDRTCFQFDYNLASQELEVLVQIYTVSGRLVKTIEQTVTANGAIRQDNCLEWDGRDDYGDRLARGVYLYKIKARTTGVDSKTQESDFEKLVLLK